MSTRKKPLIGPDGEVRELTSDDLGSFRRAADVLPATLQKKLGMRTRGPQRAPTKERITIRLSPEVVESFRTSGPGWQGRIDDALKSWLKHHEPA
ncbi:MAG TPA: BrnA antitoxin family protein [Pusillimonas sp.]